jgi:transcription elongation factor Elf1
MPEETIKKVLKGINIFTKVLKGMHPDLIKNKYAKWYGTLITNCKMRGKPTIYTESHHILPRSLGGTDVPDNLVNLTAREHFMAHLLLSKMYKGNSGIKMAQAIGAMSMQSLDGKRTRLNSKKYALAKSLINKIYQKAGKEYQKERTIQNEILSEHTDLDKVFDRGTCKMCGIRPKTVNYIKEGKTFYRSTCSICKPGKETITMPQWMFDGYKKLTACEVCNFKSKFTEQLLVTKANNKYKTVCLNCQVAIKLTPPKLKPDV